MSACSWLTLFCHIVQTESYRTQPLVKRLWGNMLKDYEKILYFYADVLSRLSHYVTFRINLLNFFLYRPIFYIKTNLVHETIY